MIKFICGVAGVGLFLMIREFLNEFGSYVEDISRWFDEE